MPLERKDKELIQFHSLAGSELQEYKVRHGNLEAAAGSCPSVSMGDGVHQRLLWQAVVQDEQRIRCSNHW